MSLAASNRFTGPIIASAGQKVFTTDWPHLNLGVQVKRKRGADEIILAVDAYAIIDWPNGFSVSLNENAQAGDIIHIIGKGDASREADFAPYVQLKNEELNAEFDRLTAVDQELTRESARAVKVEYGDVVPSVPKKDARKSTGSKLNLAVFDLQGNFAPYEMPDFGQGTTPPADAFNPYAQFVVLKANADAILAEANRIIAEASKKQSNEYALSAQAAATTGQNHASAALTYKQQAAAIADDIHAEAAVVSQERAAVQTDRAAAIAAKDLAIIAKQDAQNAFASVVSQAQYVASIKDNINSRLTIAESEITNLQTVQADMSTTTAASGLSLQSQIDNHYAQYTSFVQTLTQSSGPYQESALVTTVNNLQANMTTADASLTALITAVSSASVSRDSVLTSTVTQLSTSKQTAETSLTSYINSVNQARLSGDEALASSLSTMAVSKASAETSLAARITSVSQAQVSGDAALASITTQITASRLSAETSLTAAVSASNQARISGDEALASSLSTMAVSKTSAETSLAARITSVSQAQVSGDAALASITTQITASHVSAETSLTASVSAISAAQVAGDEVLATNIANLAASKASAETSLTASVSALNEARISGDQALAQQVNNLDARLTTLGQIAGNGTDLANQLVTINAAISNELVVRASADAALAAANQTLTSSLSTATNNFTAQISSEASTRASALGALAGNINTINASLNSVSANVTTYAEALADLDGKVSGAYGFEVDADGKIVSFRAFATGGAAPFGIMEFTADKFVFHGAALFDGSVKALQVGLNEFSKLTYIQRKSSVLFSGNNTWVDLAVVVAATLGAEFGSRLDVEFSTVLRPYNTSTADWASGLDLRLLRINPDGSTITSFDTDKLQVSIYAASAFRAASSAIQTSKVKESPAAGTYTYKLQAKLPSGSVQAESPYAILSVEEVTR